MKYEPLKIGNLVAKVPIVQGGMGVGISLGNLAGAVAKEGGVGIISTAQIGFKEENFENNPKKCNMMAIKKEFDKARAIAPEGVIGFNIMVALRYYDEYVKAAVEAGADLIISGAGVPTELPQYVEGSNTKIAPIVSSEKSVKVILKFWDKKYGRTADMVVIEGPLAGGHLGFTKDQLVDYGLDLSGEDGLDEVAVLTDYEEEIKKICKVVAEYGEKYGCEIPVVVAGGIDTAAKMKQMMDLGIQGVQVASRFVTTVECDAHDNYKQAYLKAGRGDIQIVTSPVGLPGRAIMNPFMERVMSGERIPPKKCLQCLHKCNPTEIPYCITEALVNAAKGKTDDALLFCGAGAYQIDKIETVKEVIDSLVL